MKEDRLISLIKQTLITSSDYIGDDTAYIVDKDLILTQDTLVEDVHFRMSTINAYDLGIKSIAVNLSDIASTGGIPKYILISLSLPEDTDEEFIEEFYKGVNSICNKHNVLVVGGDLTRAPQVVISVSAIGYGAGIIHSKRSNANVDDLVVVTGQFGSSRAGLWALEQIKNKVMPDEMPQSMIDKFVKVHVNPEPRIEEGRAIMRSCNKPIAMMDASDGLADALFKICVQSKVSIQINYKDIPFDNDLNFVTKLAHVNPFKWIFYGGEDYELVATIPFECYRKLEQDKVPVHVIGRVVPVVNEPTVNVHFKSLTVNIDQNAIDYELFSHFKD